MHLRIGDRKEFCSGLFYVAIGTVAAALSTRYQIGTALHMGPGFFPLLVACVLVALGVGSILQSLLKKPVDAGPSHSIFPLMMIFIGMISFAFLIERAGLIVAIAALLFFSCFQRLRERPLEVLATYGVLTAFACLLFVYFFSLPIAILPL